MILIREAKNMWSHDTAVPLQDFQVGSILRPMRLFVAAVFLFLYAAIASAQGAACYSDLWVDNSNGGFQIVGCGVTDTTYVSHMYHDSRVRTTITNPNGLSASATTVTPGTPLNPGEYAAAEVWLLWDNDNPVEGNYLVESVHYSGCPYAPFGSTSTTAGLGKFNQRYSYDGVFPTTGEHVYRVTDCITSCTATYPRRRFYEEYKGPWLDCTGVRATFFGSTTCIGKCKGAYIEPACK
jgi:hypothetical protein